jgi:cathepsin D
MSGEMGLGFAGISSGAATPFCQTLLDSGQFATREMSFWIARMSGVKNSAKVGKVGGVLTLGGRNSSLFSGEIEFLNLTSGEEGLAPTFWALPLSCKRFSF